MKRFVSLILSVCFLFSINTVSYAANISSRKASNPVIQSMNDKYHVDFSGIQHLTELIGQMKPMYRDPLRLLAMGYTNREIAKSLGLTDEVVRMRLFRGRKLLWKELNHHE
ncbi:RNA polymerase sigma factor [Faecalibacterium sp. 7]|uniref:RNA polymerase sigma factor n=1 Tax=Faecalibacterium sp. 7 TaxID=3402017 RepID=UPI003C2EE4D1